LKSFAISAPYEVNKEFHSESKEEYMNPDILPEKESRLYKKIRKKYKVKFDDLKIRGSHLQILRVTDLEALLRGKDPFKNVSEFPFWVKLWEASMLLADLLASMKPKPGQTLLELGAGMAAPGLAAAANGYKVTLSDYEPHILEFQKVSAAASGLTNIDFKIIDWLKPPVIKPFDTIVGAEILFREDFFEPLLQIFKKLLAPDGTIYLAHDVRRKSMPQFLMKAEKEYDIGVSERKIKKPDEEITIILTRMTPKS
jgi:predicted nicotinamide N-methyase